MSVLLIAITAFVAIRLTASFGSRMGLRDHPDARKRHQGAVPLTGGIAIVATIVLCTLCGAAPYSYLLLGLTLGIFAIGLCGDLHMVRASTRLLLHYSCGLLLAWWGGIVIHNVGDLLAMGDIHLLALAVPLTALSVAGLCNAYNMIDGIDGLAAATAALPLLILYLVALQAGHPQAALLLPVLVPLAVFMVFNLGPGNRLLPRVFLGDNGSVTLGFLVAALLVYFSQGAAALIKPVTALWLVALPLMDMLSTMLRRLARGKGLMVADRSHLHHILIDMGLGQRGTLSLLLGWSGVCALFGLALEALPAYLSLMCYLLLFTVHCLFALNADTLAAHLKSGNGSTRVEREAL